MGSSTQAQKLTSGLNQFIKKLERITYEYKRSTKNNSHIIEAWQDARLGVQHTSTRMQDWDQIKSCRWQRLRELLRVRARQV
jgi:quinol monooxygenase YgiN